MPVERLVEFLDQNRMQYRTIDHSRAFTAQEVAAAAHVPGQELAKPVIVKIDGELAMAVLPANLNVDLGALAGALGAERAELADEEEFADVFAGCEVGAMPPFGNLWGVPVYVDESLEADEEIAFSGGSHSEVVRMRYGDYKRLAGPQVLRFGRRAN